MMLRLVLCPDADAVLIECMQLGGQATTGEVIRDALIIYRAVLSARAEGHIKDNIYASSPDDST